MKRILALVLALALACAATSALAESPSLDEQFAKLLRGHKATGAVICVAKDGEIVYEYNYGYADKRSKEKVNEDTYFRIASVTKLVTGIHVMQLVEQGKLDLDTSIGDYLGYTVKNLYWPDTPVTLRHLMSHTSSLRPYGGYSSSRKLLSDLLNAEYRRRGNWYDYAPGSKYDYSNFGAGIMGALIEAVTGKNLNTSVTDDLFSPLGIDAAYHATLLKEPEKIASVYTETGAMMKSRKVTLSEEWDGTVDPERHYRVTVGSLWIRGRDLCRLGIMLAQGGKLDGMTILQKETVEAMLADQKGQGYVTCATPYGLCVNRVDNLLKDRMIYGHQGMTEGILCNLYFDPETQFVFALITNGSSTKMNDHIGKLARKTFALAWENFSGE